MVTAPKLITMQIKTALLDPHPIIHNGFKDFFKETDHISVDIVAYDVKELMEALELEDIDVVISEMDLPGGSLIKMIKDVKKFYPNISILIYTSFPNSVYAVSILKAGATGFLSKKAKQEVIMEAIENVYQDRYHITTNFANEITRNIDVRKPRTVFGKLSAREVEVLKYLVEGKRNVDIANILEIHQKTINTYKSRIMKKLHVRSVVDLYQQARNLDIL